MKAIPKLDKINNGDRIFYNPNSVEKNFFLEIKKEIEKKYHIIPSNRDQIIKQLISRLTHGDYTNYTIPNIDLRIIRSDIKKFFPTINKHILYKKISTSNILSLSTMDTLKPMFFSHSVSGIPLGLPFSNALAEIYLEKFDKDIRTEFNPIFYFRYVDDIIIINYKTKYNEHSDLSKLDYVFEQSYLERNKNKTKFTTLQGKQMLTFNFLGYHFESKNCRNTTKLIITFSDTKFKKITDNIKNDFYKYKKSSKSKKEFWKLYYKTLNRIYGVTSIDKNGNVMRFGLGYSYRFINDKAQLNELISIVKGLIFSCKLTSYQTSTLLHLISIDSNSLEILEKRYDYTKLTTNQLETIKRRLNLKTDSNNLSRIFFELYR